MTFRGTVRQGVVVLEDGARLDEGTPVEVRPVAEVPADAPTSNGAPTTIWEKLAELSGTVEDLPPDAARNVDHYLYGAAKRGE